MPSLQSVLAVVALAAAGVANAKTIVVTASSDNKFDPDSFSAARGDTVDFHFEAKNHSVVAGDYQYPCSPMQIGSGFFSGFISTDDDEADKVFRVTINNTDPIPFYSSQGSECSQGMVGIINPSRSENVTDYKDRASGLSKGVTPGTKVFGGQVVDADEADDGDNDDDDDDSDSDKSNDDDNSGSGAGQLSASLGFLVAAGFAICVL